MLSLRRLLRTSGLAIALQLASCEGPPTNVEPVAPEAEATADRFPSYSPAYPPPADWAGPVFQLSQDYPKELPGEEPQPWMEYDFRTQPEEYLLALREYVYEGMIARGADDWNAATNPVRTWYHMPWRQVGDTGREFIHGLTFEFPATPGSLGRTQRVTESTWAIAMYNPVAGYTVGQVWPSPLEGPNLEAADYAVGAVIIKALFTMATPETVPSMQGAFEWQADVYPDPNCVKVGCKREITTVRLIQLDFAVKDPRAADTLWVYGNLVYDYSVEAESVWEKMIPLGVMWGNDPELTASMKDAKPKESIVFYNRNEHPVNAFYPLGMSLDVDVYEHLGCHGRLVGPVDNPKSACLSCHATSQYPPANAFPQGTLAQCDDPALNGALWRNIKGGEIWKPCAEKTFPLDYSLELADAVQAYFEAQGQDTTCDDPATPDKEPKYDVRRYQ